MLGIDASTWYTKFLFNGRGLQSTRSMVNMIMTHAEAMQPSLPATRGRTIDGYKVQWATMVALASITLISPLRLFRKLASVISPCNAFPGQALDACQACTGTNNIFISVSVLHRESPKPMLPCSACCNLWHCATGLNCPCHEPKLIRVGGEFRFSNLPW